MLLTIIVPHLYALSIPYGELISLLHEIILWSGDFKVNIDCAKLPQQSANFQLKEL